MKRAWKSKIFEENIIRAIMEKGLANVVECSLSTPIIGCGRFEELIKIAHVGMRFYIDSVFEGDHWRVPYRVTTLNPARVVNERSGKEEALHEVTDGPYVGGWSYYPPSF